MLHFNDNVRPKEKSIGELEKSWQPQIKKKNFWCPHPFDVYIHSNPKNEPNLELNFEFIGHPKINIHRALVYIRRKTEAQPLLNYKMQQESSNHFDLTLKIIPWHHIVMLTC